MKTNLLYSKLLSAAVLTGAALAAGSAAWAQSVPAGAELGGPQAAPAEEPKHDVIIVTGTRTTGLTAADSPAPVVVLDVGTLEHTGQPDLIQALSQNVPSFTAQAFGGDSAALTLSAKLRGLSPNHALVLVNGKRRHGTANLAVLGGAYQGNAGADLSFIPVGSIDHVEVLLDGAAAQYGTDAIAGVINIIQKKADTGGSVTVSGGQYFDQGGETADLMANTGWKPFDGAYLNLTLESKFHDFSFRGDFDPRVVDGPWNTGATNSPAKSYPQVVTAPNWPYVNRIAGDPQYRLNVMNFNGGYEFSDSLEFYTFGSYGFKKAQAHENYRLPNVVKGKDPTDIAFPLGFDPREGTVEQDYSYGAGFSGHIGGFRWDLSSVYGEDKVKLSVLGTANADYYKDTSVLATSTTPYLKGFTPRDVLAGTFDASQWTTTFDGSYDLDVGWSDPVTLAGGAEYREDGYKLSAGNPVSYDKGGTQSFYGFAPVNQSDVSRDSWAVYFDGAAKPLKALSLDAAVRYEKYSDFGDTTVGKLTARYDFSDAFAIRGAASTGFRAPTLAEGYYAGINVSPSSIGGQLPPNSPGATLLGINGLKPEKSTNYSAGFVAHPISKLSVTLDAYQIEISDRIVGSGTLTGASSSTSPLVTKLPVVVQAIAANGVQIDSSIFSNASWSIGAAVFTNGLDTRTRGADLVISYDSNFDAWGDVDWTLSGNYTETKVTHIAPPPAALLVGATGPEPSLFDRSAIKTLEDASPKFRLVGTAVWKIGKYTIVGKETLNGPASSIAQGAQDGVYRETKLDRTYITDLELGYEITDSVKVALGANNLFNQYPAGVNATNRQQLLNLNSNGFVTKYSTLSPFGINGGYYYGKLTYSF